MLPHENERAQSQFLVDRCGEIHDAAGGKQVDRVYADKVTGNCSHQLGTARMGNDPELSVFNRNCRAHQVDNLSNYDVVAVGATTLRRGRLPVPDRHRRQPHLDHHGERLAGRGPRAGEPQLSHHPRAAGAKDEERPTHIQVGRPWPHPYRRRGTVVAADVAPSIAGSGQRNLC